MAEVVTFNGTSLTTVSGLEVIATDPHRPAPRTLNMDELAQTDKSSVSNAFYYNRKIHVMCTINRTTKANLQSSLRDLEAILQAVEATLNFSIAGVSTDFTATKSNLSVSNMSGGFCEVDIEFICSNPTGYANSSTTLYNYAALVGSAYQFAVKWSGNVKQQPVITITINSLLGGTSKTITVGNATTLEAVSVQRTWTASDILIVNCKTKTITINGTEVDYTGKIPEFEGSQKISYADDISHRNIAVNIVYQQRNL